MCVCVWGGGVRGRSFLYIFWHYLVVKAQNGNIFGGYKISNIFWVCMICPIF